MVHEGRGELVCCGQPMKLFVENSVDAAREKHVPVKDAGVNCLTVRIGSVPHPMEEKHYIEWVEIVQDGKAYRQFLKAGEAPEAVFPVQGEWTAREYCNLHGLWKA